jgi:hypothetical protein
MLVNTVVPLVALRGDADLKADGGTNDKLELASVLPIKSPNVLLGFK